MSFLVREDYTSEQWAVVTAAPDKDLIVQAGPGAGKSRTTAARIAHLLTDLNVPAQGIVATTFTSSASAVLFERVFDLVAKGNSTGQVRYNLDELTVATLHSYLRTILLRHVPSYGKMRVYSNAERDLLLRRPQFARIVELQRVERLDLEEQLLAERDQERAVRRRGRGESRKDQTPFLTNHPDDRRLFLNAADCAREEGLTLDVLPDGFAAALTAYTNLLAERNIWDYSGLLCAAYHTLTDDSDPENTALQNYLRQNLRCLLVDEFQDCNVLLIRVISRLNELGARIVAIGDSDQVCYRFRGSDPRVFAFFARRLPNAERHLLSENFRSTSAIVSCSSSFLGGEITQREPKPLRTPDVAHQVWEQGDLAVLMFRSTQAQDQHAVTWFRSLHGSPYRDKPNSPVRGLTWSDMRVTTRTTDSAMRIAATFEAAGLPCKLVGEQTLFGSAEERAVGALYAFLGGRAAESNAYEAWFAANLGVDEDAVKRALSYLQAARDASASEDHGPACLIGIGYSALRQMRFSHDVIPALAPRHADLALTNVARIFRAAQSYQSVFYRARSNWKFADFARWLFDEAPRVFEDDFVPPVPLSSHDAIQISTIHSAKGTESVAVWIADLHAGHLPHFRSREDVYSRLWEVIPRNAVKGKARYDGTPDDEARLMYVGLTRASKFLLLSYGRPDARVSKTGRPLPIPDPSPYLLKMRSNPHFVREPAQFPAATLLPKERPWQPSDNAILRLTPSQLAIYHACPHQFRYRVVHGFPPPTSENLGYAESLHRCNAQLEQATQGEEGEEQIADIALPQLLEKQFDVPFASAAGREQLRMKAEETFAAYARWARERKVMGFRTESIESNITVRVANVETTGRLDMAQRGPDKRKMVLDWKASKRAAARDPDFVKSQIYALGEEARTGELISKVGVCIAQGPNPPILRTIPFDDNQRALLKQSIAEAGRAIPAFELPMIPLQGVRTCADCDTAPICSRGQEENMRTT